MRINSINPTTIRQVSDREILSLHFRLHQLAGPYIKREDFDDPRFSNICIRHAVVGSEMIRRGLRFKVVDELDRRGYPEIDQFLERFLRLIPSRLSEISKLALIKLHNQLHSVWEIIHIGHPSAAQQEELWNFHKLIVREMEKRDIHHPSGWDSLDRPLGRALGSSDMYPSGEETGEWLFIEDVVNCIPREVQVVESIALVDSKKKEIWLSNVGGRQLTKVMYFRILRQFPREEWSSFRPVSEDVLGSIDVTYDLYLKKLEPLWTVQLSLQFNDLCLVKPYLYFVGGIVTQGASRNDIDVLLRGGLDTDLEQEIFDKFIKEFPEGFRERFSRVEDHGLGPYTSYIGVCSLDLIRSDSGSGG